MVHDVATALARLAEREMLLGEEHLVFPGELGLFQDASALRDRYKAARAQDYVGCASTICAITRTAGLCALLACLGL